MVTAYYFFKKMSLKAYLYSVRSIWAIKFRSLVLPQYSPRIKYGGYPSPLKGGSE